jgi:hypothetical protein
LQPEPQQLKELAAAALTLITGDDIRRLGVTTIADALALAGGPHVRG